MRTTRLIAVLTGIAAIAIVAANAHAMYHPGLGRFLQRDPGPGTGAPMRLGAAGPATLGGFAPRDPIAGRYADGMNLYQYVRSAPLHRTDPTGQLSSDHWAWCEGAGVSLHITTDWCCPDKVKVIERAACSAFKTMKKTRDAIWPLRDIAWSKDVPAENRAAHNRFINFFNGGRWFNEPPPPTHRLGPDEIAPRLGQEVRHVDHVYFELLDELDDPPDGTHYSCLRSGDRRCEGGNSGYANPLGWTVHLCDPFFYELGDAGRSSTIIHELSHLYQQTWDQNSDGMFGAYTYIRGGTFGDTPAQIEGVPTYTDGIPTRFRTHADTLAEFTMKWFVP